MPKRLKDWGFLLLFIVLAQLAGVIGLFFTTGAIPDWYAFLDKPTFTPPSWIFGPVWIALYALMGTATFLVWNTRSGLNPERAKARDRGFWIFWIHLFFNALWSVLFFGLHNPFYALIDIGLLIILVVITTLYFFRVSLTAAF